MSRLSLQVFYLWRHVLSTAPPFILWWSNLEILFVPLHRTSPFIGGLRCQAIQTEHGPYITERTQKSVYIMRCLWSGTAHKRPSSEPRCDSDPDLQLIGSKNRNVWSSFIASFDIFTATIDFNFRASNKFWSFEDCV
jgi:hypothetical protein